MQFDHIYIFNKKNLRKDVKNLMLPYTMILDILLVKSMVLVDGKKFVIKCEYEKKTMILVFPNIIECWKFYTYVRVLYYNAVEYQNSLCYDIDLNIRILLDDYRFKSMENVILVLIDNYNLKYNRELALKEDRIIEEDVINFKAITEFFEKLMVAFYSLHNWKVNIEKLKLLIDKFQLLYFEYIKDLLKNTYTEIHLIYDSLMDSLNHFNVLRKWSITDDRFFILFVYLSHAYKIKFININSEIVVSKYLNNYQKEEFYLEEDKLMIDGLFDFVRTNLKKLDKLKTNRIFKSILLEFLSKFFFNFFMNLDAMILHENFELDIKLIPSLINGLLDVPEKLKKIKKLIKKTYGITPEEFKVIVKVDFLIRRIDQIIDNLLHYILKKGEEPIKTSIEQFSLSKMKPKKIFETFKILFKSIKDLDQVPSDKFDLLKISLVLEYYTHYLIARTPDDIFENIKNSNEKFKKYLKNITHIDLTYHVIYLDFLETFFLSENFFECEKALSSMCQLLNFKLNKTNLLYMISKKKYSEKSTKSNLKKKLSRIVIIHFSEQKKFETRRQSKENMWRKLKRTIQAIKFLKRVINRKKVLKKSKKASKMVSVFENSKIELDIESIKKVPIEYFVTSKGYMKLMYKGFELSDILSLIPYEQGFLYFQNERIMLFNSIKNLVYYHQYWKIQELIKDGKNEDIIINFEDEFAIVLKIKKDKIRTKVFEILNALRKKKKKYFQTEEFSISGEKEVQENLEMLHEIYENTRYALIKPKIWKKMSPPFHHWIQFLRYEFIKKKDKKKSIKESL